MNRSRWAERTVCLLEGLRPVGVHSQPFTGVQREQPGVSRAQRRCGAAGLAVALPELRVRNRSSRCHEIVQHTCSVIHQRNFKQHISHFDTAIYHSKTKPVHSALGMGGWIAYQRERGSSISCLSPSDDNNHLNTEYTT